MVSLSKSLICLAGIQSSRIRFLAICVEFLYFDALLGLGKTLRMY